MHKVYSYVIHNVNEGMEVLKGAGFEVEAVLKAEAKQGDEYVDVVAYDFYNQDLGSMRKWYNRFQQDYPGKLYAISEFGNIPKVSEFWADGQYWNFLIPWYDYDRTSQPGSDAFNSTDHNNANIEYWNDALGLECVVTRDELPSFKE